MSRRRAVATVTIAAACVAAAGCTSTVEGAALASRGGGALTTTAAPTTSAAPAPAAAPAPSPWINIPSVPVAEPDDLGHAAFGRLPIPGVQLRHQRADGDWRLCTLGPVVHSADGRLGFVTAGHCALPPGGGAEQYLQADRAGTDTLKLGTASGAVDDDDSIDSAVVWTGQYDPRATISSVGGHQVDRVMSEAEARKLPDGTPICIVGAVTGIKCSPLISATHAIQIGDFASSDDAAAPGDSGGVVFVVNRDTQRAVLVGLVQRAGGISMATYLEPALARLGAQAVTINDS
jgi:hypothetical protein